MTTNTDRTVHGITPTGGEVVRYDRAGKWYLEYPSGQRNPVSLIEAVTVAWAGAPRLDLPGGGRFDAEIRRLNANSPRESA